MFEYKPDGEVYACQRLPNGNTFIGECSSGNLLEVDPAGHDFDYVYLRDFIAFFDPYLKGE